MTIRLSIGHIIPIALAKLLLFFIPTNNCSKKSKKKINILYAIAKYMFNNIFLDNHDSKSHIYKIKLLRYDLWIY